MLINFFVAHQLWKQSAEANLPSSMIYCFFKTHKLFCRCGSKDSDTYKLFAVHIYALLPPTALEVSIPTSAQVAAILGTGLLFLETCERHLVKVLLQEIGRPPGPEMENATDRESHSLTAGLALGMVMLGV